MTTAQAGPFRCRVCGAEHNKSADRYRCEDGHRPTVNERPDDAPAPGMKSSTVADVRDYDLGMMESWAGMGDVQGLMAHGGGFGAIAHMALVLDEHGLTEASAATLEVIALLDQVGDRIHALSELWRDMRRLNTGDGGWADVHEANVAWLAARASQPG